MRRTILLDMIPPSTNHYKAQRWTGKFIQWYLTKKAKDFQENFKEHLKSYIPVETPLDVEINYVFPDRRKHDIDNYCKILLDCMQGSVYKDDNQIVRLTLNKKYEKNNPSTTIIIRECD